MRIYITSATLKHFRKFAAGNCHNSCLRVFSRLLCCQAAAFSMIILLALANSVRADENSCELDEVKIGFRAKTCAFQDYAITLNGEVASGFGTQCISFIEFPNFTNKAWTSLKVDKTYQVTAGTALCITHINFDVPEGYVMYIDGVESKTIFKTNGGFVFSGDGTWNVVVRKKCASGTDSIGQATPSNGNVIWEVGMGKLGDGRSAERISFREKILSPSIYTPAVLVYSPPAKTVEVDVVKNGDGSLRQVKAPQGLADVVVINSSEYDIRYYQPADVGAKVGGVYTLTGQPYVTWKIKNPDAAGTTKLHILKIEGGVTVDKTEYLWDPMVDSWTLSTGWSPSTGNYARIETKVISYPTQFSRTETFVVKENDGQVISKKANTYRTFAWGEELVQEVLDPDSAALTTTYTYYEVPTESRYRKLKTITFPDGLWEKYDYDIYWNIFSIMRPWKDQSPETATEANSHLTLYGASNTDGYFFLSDFARILFDIEERLGGVTVRKTRFPRSTASASPEPLVNEFEASYQSASNGFGVGFIQETITTRYHHSATQFLANRVSSILYPDGRKDTYSYEKGDYVPNADPSLSEFTPNANGLAQRESVVHGTNAAPNGIAFKTTKETTVRDRYGNQVLRETYVYNGTGYERIAWTVMDYDYRGHLVMSRDHKGQMTTATWNGEQKISEIDAAGVETTYTYDSLNRVKTQTKKGLATGGGFPAQDDIVTTFSYDAESQQTGEVVTGGSLNLSSSRAYDKAGRLTRETNQTGLTTTYAYANGGRIQTITRPGGATEVIDKYFDGQLKSITGSATVARYFDNGVNADGTRWMQDFIGSGGLSSPRWTKTTVDWIDRTVSVEKPSFTGTNVIRTAFYNTLGQLHKQTTMAGPTKLIADMLYEYDELGRQIRTGLDVNGDGALTLVSTDRLSESDGILEKVGTDWFNVNTIRDFLTDNNDTPTMQVQRVRLNNFPLNGSEQTVTDVTVTAVTGNNTRRTTAIDRAAKKQIASTDTPDSNLNAVTISVNGLLQSSTPTTPQTATTYAYDSLGRPISTTDPRTGTITRSFSTTTGQLVSINDGAGTTSYEYHQATHISAGRLKAQTNAAGKKSYFNYNSRGQLIQTWGDTTYPLEYLYDAYGQRTELHTFRGGQNWSASVWPSSTTGTADAAKWIYQESTGLLTQKQDAALKGTIYTYDELGRVKTRVWARGITCTYGYDANTGELRTVTYSDSTPAVALTYDRGGRQTNVTDAAGSHTRTFTVAGDPLTEQITGGVLDGVGVNVGYDSLLRRNSLQTSHGANTLSNQTYGYDPTSRLQTVTSGSQTATYAYHPNSGLLNTTSFTGGTSISRSYDSLGRLENITTTPAADTAQSYTYTNNNLNQRTRVTREDGSYWSFIYNDRGELVSGKKYWSDNSLVLGAQTEYNFDNIGNRKDVKSGGNQLGNLRQSNYTTNSLNQYSQRSVLGAVDVTGTANTAATVTVNNQATARKSDYFYKELTVDNSTAAANAQINVVGARNNFGAGGEDAVTQKGGRAFLPQTPEVFTYDDDGNLTSDGHWNYTWDADNRLASIEALANLSPETKQRLEFSYDYMSRRIQKKVYAWNIQTSTYQLQSVRKFVNDGWNVVAELDGNNTLVRSFVWGQDLSGTLQDSGGVGGLLLINDSGQTYQAGYDGSGNVTSLIKAGTGTISASYEYDPFGMTVKAIGEYAESNPYRFSTKYTDAETSLVYYGYRYYQPQTGRWLSRDPLGEDGGVNVYGFVGNNTIGQIDPTGLFEIDVHYYLTYFLARQTGCFDPWEAKKVAEGNQQADEDTRYAPGQGKWHSHSIRLDQIGAEQRRLHEEYHALTPKENHPRNLKKLMDEAAIECKDKDRRKLLPDKLMAFGRYLHYIQDMYSHQDYPDPWAGHGIEFLRDKPYMPDKTHGIGYTPITKPWNALDWHRLFEDFKIEWNKYDRVQRAREMVDRTWDELKKYAKQYKCCDASESNRNNTRHWVEEFLNAYGGKDDESIDSRPDLIEGKRTALRTRWR